MMFKGSAEFSPETKGPHSIARSNIMPYPSTIAGTISTLILERYKNLIPDTNKSNWGEEMSKILGSNLILRGPYLIKSYNDTNQEVFVQNDQTSFIKVSSNGFLKTRNNHSSSITDKSYTWKPNFVNVFGIQIDDNKKTIKSSDNASSIYSSNMVSYSDRNSIHIHIAVDVINSSEAMEEAFSKNNVVRLGGEGRLVRVFSSDKPVFEYDTSLNKSNTFMVISPLLFETGKSNIDYKNGGLLSEDMITLFKDSRIELLEGIIGLVSGFSSTRRTRKPIYGAIMPGARIALQDKVNEIGSLIREKGLGIYSNLGFGTLVPELSEE